MRSKVTPRKVAAELKGWGGVEQEEFGLEVSLVGIDREGHLTFARVERKTLVLRPALQSKQSSLCGLHRSSDRGKEDQMAKSSL